MILKPSNQRKLLKDMKKLVKNDLKSPTNWFNQMII